MWGRGEVHTEFWRTNLRERVHLEDLGIVGITTLKCVLKK
jgi:hypothetical protein